MEYGQPDGHGRYGIIDETADGILCHTCGKRYRHLATHIAMGHGDTVADYRARHGLPVSRPLVAQSVRERMRDSWESHRDVHLAALEEYRDPMGAVQASVPVTKRRSAGARAGRDAYLRARTGRALTDGEKARLGAAGSVAEWSRVALEILGDPSVSVRSLAASVGMKAVTVQARVSRYRGGPGPGSGNRL